MNTIFKKIKNSFRKKAKLPGYTLLETLVYAFLVSLTLLLVATYVFWFNYSNLKTTAQREVTGNAQTAMDAMLFEIRGAKNIYTPTSNASQLSLETSSYLPDGETSSFIDFFVCGSRLCMKKELQSPIFMTSETTQVLLLKFTQAEINSVPSVRIELSLRGADTQGVLGTASAITLMSSASSRGQ